MPKLEASDPAKLEKRKGRWLIYALAAVLVFDLLLMFLPLGGTWSANYAFAVGAMVVMAALVEVSREVKGGFEDALSRLDKSAAALDSSLQAVASKMEQSEANSSAKADSLGKSMAEDVQTTKGVASSLSGVARTASATEKMGAEIGEKVVALQGTLDGIAKNLSGVEGTETEIRGTLDALKFNMREAEQSSADLRRAVILLGTAEGKKVDVAAESKELLLAMGKSLGEVQSGISGLEKSSAEAAVRLDGVVGTKASLVRMGKTVSRVDERLAKLARAEGGLSRVEKSLSRIDSKLDKAAARQRAKPVRPRRARAGAWNVESPLASSPDEKGEKGAEPGGDASSGKSSQ